MLRRVIPLAVVFAFLVTSQGLAQLTPWYQWTLISPEVMDEIIGETSGETAWNSIMEMGGYNKNRLADEYSGTFYEVQYLYDKLNQYGIPGAEVVRFPGREVWDGVKGERWE